MIRRIPRISRVSSELLRHQASALVATAADFATMTLAVELLHLAPGLATLLGATVGGATSFSLGRRVVFRAARGRVSAQVARYVAVSLTSALLNAALEWLFASRAPASYLGVRVCGAAVVGILWNYPMHKYFVFSHKGLRSAFDETTVAPESPGRLPTEAQP